MRVQIEPTDVIVDLEGLECRVWNGITDDGNQVFVFVHRVASREEIQGLERREGGLQNGKAL